MGVGSSVKDGHSRLSGFQRLISLGWYLLAASRRLGTCIHFNALGEKCHLDSFYYGQNSGRTCLVFDTAGEVWQYLEFAADFSSWLAIIWGVEIPLPSLYEQIVEVLGLSRKPWLVPTSFCRGYRAFVKWWTKKVAPHGRTINNDTLR